MSSRLSESSNSSSDEESEMQFTAKKKRFRELPDIPTDQRSKMPCLDNPNYSDSYYNSNIESKKDGSRDFQAVHENFYLSDKESDKKSESSYCTDSGFLSSSKISSGASSTSFQTDKKNGSSNKSVAERLMEKMGYKKGGGLGKKLQGISEPVAASTQKGRRGLGLELKELENAQIEFNPDDEIVQVKEEILWLQNHYDKLPTIEEVSEWETERRQGERKDTINGETTFCSEDILNSVINSKSVFDRLDKNEMREARTRSNPFETIRGSIFLNRAAVKMANIDRACDFIFTKPANLHPDELLYFADVCAGPGGFSEYVLWRKKWRAKGFGFTLKKENDFKLHDFHAGPCETFHPYYGPKNDGDVYIPENQEALRDLIMNQTENQGVHFMMADGGFSVEGQENIQEILSKQLYLCQCLVALMIVRTNGHFVTKVFDLFTPFSAGLVYIMYRCFNRISIFKPNTSRPANSERYLICQGKLPNINHIVDYLFKANKRLLKNNKHNDILELVPEDRLIADKEFFEYLKNSNEMLGHRQIVGLKKIAAYTEDKSLFETRQKKMKEECLKYWGLPDEARTLPLRTNPSTKVKMLLQECSNAKQLLDKSSYKDAVKLTKESFGMILANEHDWFCLPCSSGEGATGIEEKSATLYLGMGRTQVYKYCDKDHWEHVSNVEVELPRDTLVYAEMITEYRKERQSQSKTYGLHILDAFSLGSENISQKYYTDRMKLIQLFCKSLWKPADRNFSPVRVKEYFPISPNLSEKLIVNTKIMKNGAKALGYFPAKHYYENDSNDPYYYIPRSIVFFKATEEPWARHRSSSNQMYFYNKSNADSRWEIPDSARANFIKVILSRIIWNWPSEESISMTEFVNHLIKKKSRPK